MTTETTHTHHPATDATLILTRHHATAGTVIALAACALFGVLSSGSSLAITFIPGMVVTWLTFVWLYRHRVKMPEAARFLPAYFSVLAIQFLHFAEEYATGFNTDFALLYDGSPYSQKLFVTFNMASYAVFTLTCLAAFTKRAGQALVPALFFIIYGAIGNAIAHTWWSLYLGDYFPGLITAQLYWIAGPWLLLKIVGDRKQVAKIVIAFAAILIPALTLFAHPGAL